MSDNSNILQKAKSNLVISVIYLIIASGLVFAGINFINLQSTQQATLERVTGVETSLTEIKTQTLKIDKVIENSTILQTFERDSLKQEAEIRSLRGRIRQLEIEIGRR